MKKKYSFTLLEVMIASVLVGVVLTFLFTFFRQTLARKQQIHTIKERVMQVELVRLRLMHLFNHLAKEKGNVVSLAHPEADGKACLLYGGQGIDPDPSFSKEGYAMLYKTQDNRLALCRWNEEKKRTRIDTLLKKVESLSFSFFTDGKWQDCLKRGESSSASMIKMQFKLEGKEEKEQLFLFSLCSPDTISLEKKR